jgi:pilus assembly protein CpaB
LRRRILTIALAVVLAAVGTVAVLGYVHQANIRAIQGIKPTTVLVANSAIPSGTPAGQALRQGALVYQTEPADSVPTDAIRSLNPALAGLVTSGNVPSGAVLTRSMLVSGSEVTGGVAIPPGTVAVTIQLCLSEAVAGYITAGSHVAVLDTYVTGGSLSVQESCNVSHEVQAVGAVHTALVLSKVEVLSVGPAPASTQSTSGGTGALSNSPASSISSSGAMLVTLAVPPLDAERLVELDEAGLPYLALLAPNSNTGFNTAPVALFQQP